MMSCPSIKMGKLIDLTGQKRGRLTVIERSGTAASGHALWLCKCDCGNTYVVSSNQLGSGTKSCGCLQRERASAVASTTNKSWVCAPRKNRIPIHLRRLHQTYRDMRTRCENPNNKRYSLYGGRGISVCDEWKNSFAAFVDWAESSGYNDALTLDRVDTDGDYCPDNCRWATQKVQNNNRRNNHIVEYKGETMTLHELSDRYGIGYKVLWARVHAGWDINDAVERPIRRSVNGHYVV